MLGGITKTPMDRHKVPWMKKQKEQEELKLR